MNRGGGEGLAGKSGGIVGEESGCKKGAEDQKSDLQLYCRKAFSGLHPIPHGRTSASRMRVGKQKGCSVLDKRRREVFGRQP